MFTGLVEAAVPIRSYEAVGTGARLVLPSPAPGDLALEAAPGSWGPSSSEPWSAAIGDSIAVGGACLTVAELLPGPDGAAGADGAAGPDMAFDLTAETLERTWFADHAAAGRVVNVERALRVGDRLGGHMVSGHVDTLGKAAGRADVGDGGAVFTFEVPAGFERYLVDKGSITIDGISLTVVSPVGPRFDVAVIPHTLDRTHLAHLQEGDPIHLEADLVAKWVERLAT
ncbi:MAG: riboflavin synthase [Planctomycetota bacterium]|jgi:riboflavin synthase